MKNVVNEKNYKDVLIDRLSEEKKDYFLSVVSSIKEFKDPLSVLEKESYKLSCYEELLFQITFQINYEEEYEKEIKHFRNEISLFSMYNFYMKHDIDIRERASFVDFLSIYFERLEWLEKREKRDKLKAMKNIATKEEMKMTIEEIEEKLETGEFIAEATNEVYNQIVKIDKTQSNNTYFSVVGYRITQEKIYNENDEVVAMPYLVNEFYTGTIVTKIGAYKNSDDLTEFDLYRLLNWEEVLTCEESFVIKRTTDLDKAKKIMLENFGNSTILESEVEELLEKFKKNN